MEQSTNHIPARLTYLEGMRGLAAVAVLIHHLVFAFYPSAAVHAQSYDWASLGFVRWIVTTPLAVVFDGAFAVRLFFVHSGLVLSYRFFRGNGDTKPVVMSALGRYFRLTPPMAASILVAYSLLAMGLMTNQQAGKITGSAWLSSMYLMQPDLVDALSQSFWSSYFNYPGVALSYNSNLWTIRTELFGSFFVYSFLLLFGRLKSRYLFYIASFAIFFGSDIQCFILGMILCDIYILTKMYRRQSGTVALCALLAGIYFGSFVTYTGLLYEWMQIWNAAEIQTTVKAFSAVVVIAALLMLPLIQKFLNTAIIQYLGRISYSLYLIHIPIICSVMGSLFIYLNKTLSFSYVVASIIASITAVLSSFVLSHFLSILVDEPAIRCGKSVAKELYTTE